MKKRRNTLLIIGLVIVMAGGFVVYTLLLRNDTCTDYDRQINNCVPAGKCGPTLAIDAVIDCDPKNYDRKFDPTL